MARDPLHLARHDPDDLSPGRHLDPQQPLHRQAVGKLLEEVREVVGPGDERDALLPGSVFAVLLDAGVEVSDHRAAGDDPLSVELEDQAEHPVGGGVLRPHVDDHGLVAQAAGGLPCRHRYSPRSSGGGMNAPLYWVLTPPIGSSFRRGWPTQSSGISIRRRSGWPSNMTPKKSKTSRS